MKTRPSKSKFAHRTRHLAGVATGVLFATVLGARAGDILRGGSSATVVPTRGAAGGGANAAAAAQAKANASDALKRNTNAIQAVRNMQNAARKLALTRANLGLDPNHSGVRLPNVPNGLGIGGLQVAPGVPKDLKNPTAAENAALWTGAKLPTQTTAGGKTDVTIKQTAQQAVLTWDTFNIGKETTLNFDQSKGGTDASKWIAFNKINDPTGRPSQILGAINAQGQVYVINQNGILFGGSSQVNVHALVASSLPINDNLLGRGLLNNPDAQFLFSSLSIPAGTNGTPAFTPTAPLTPDGQIGDVVVQAGAQISAPASAEHIGGRVALVGANVTNAGTISTPDGQTILASGLQIGFAAHASSDPSLRGLDVFVGAVIDPNSTSPRYAGSAVNSGLIDAPRAAVTLAGMKVAQNGAIDSSTSVSLNGRIDLLADYNAVSSGGLQNLPPFLPKAAGSITLGASSVTQILPELESTETVVGTKLALPSQLNVRGLTIHLEDDASVLAPSGNVAFSAGNWSYTVSGGVPLNQFVYTGGQIYLDAGASIEVAGTPAVSVPISQNILSLQFRGAELSDSPLQRDGVLRGPTIYLDARQTGVFNGLAWVGTPLADASGYVGLIQRTVGELTTAGGTVALNAGASVVLQAGSLVDVSGGWINYEGGLVRTTRVITGGQIIDIANATPDRVYDGIYTGTFTTGSAKWGVSDTFTNPLALDGAHFEDGYLQGAAGGSINISAAAMALDGDLRGNTLSGPRQRSTPAGASSLSLSFKAQDGTDPAFPFFSPTPPTIIFQPASDLLAANPFSLDEFDQPAPLRADRRDTVILSPELLDEDGFGILKIDNGDGDVVLPEGVRLKGQPGGSLTISAANFSILGDITMPGGTISLSAFNLSPFTVGKLTETPPADPKRGALLLGGNATLSTAGLLVDDRANVRDALTRPLLTGGGAITLAGYDVALASGSVLDVSGGVAVSPKSSLTYGNAGSISVLAGQDLNLKAVTGGLLELSATLLGYSGTQGGALTIQAPLVQIGGTTANPDTLLLTPAFFDQGGFSRFTLNGLGEQSETAGEYLPGLVIAAGTHISPQVTSLLAQLNTTSGDALLLTPTLLPSELRSAVSLSFGATGVRDSLSTAPLVVRGDLVLGAGAIVNAGLRGTVNLTGDTVKVLGSVLAPGGVISISGATNSASFFSGLVDAPATTVYLGAQSELSAAGATLRTLNPYGFQTGSVLAGGSISVSGNLLARAGALLDVSGSTDALDFQPIAFGLTGAGLLSANSVVPLNSGVTAPLFSRNYLSMQVDSSGGSIALKGGQQLLSDATLRGDAGGDTALGGSLSVSSGRFTAAGGTQTPLDPTLVVTQGGSSIPGSFQGGIGDVVTNRKGNAVAGLGHFAVDQFSSGGFDALTFGGAVDFHGPITISAARSLTIASAGVLYANSATTLIAPYVVLGQAFRPPLPDSQETPPFTIGDSPFYFDPTHGKGQLTVVAELIDVGNLSLQNIGRANLIADGGEIRGDGTFDVAGSIYLRAAQIYPPSAVSFTISASDYTANNVAHSGKVTIAGSGVRALPLSAGGELNVYASIIHQGGTLRAPLGTINLGWNGTGTGPTGAITNQAVASAENLTLANGSMTSVSAIDPISGLAVTIPYGINVNGTAWIDPRGVDITTGGLPQKAINISAASVKDQAGSALDLRGGGDLYAYRFVNGQGGTQDILANAGSFAVIPGYGSDFAPIAGNNPNTVPANLASGDPGYVNGTLKVGDQVYLGASSGLKAGVYTLLPARYALLAGAFLVTPQSGALVGSMALPDGSSLVSGYRFNDLNSERDVPTLSTRFAVAPSTVVAARAQYDSFFANDFLAASAEKAGTAIPRLPSDGGHLVLQATTAMTLQGRVFGQAGESGRGGLVDIASPVDIVIGGANTASVNGALMLNATQLSQFGAESLMIGGIRDTSNGATEVTVNTGNLTVDNAGSPLQAPEIILVARNSLTLATGAVIQQSGEIVGGADRLVLGDSATAGSGDGLLLRVSSDPNAQIARRGVSGSALPTLTVGANVRLAGGSLILDSTAGATLDASAQLAASTISLDAGRISLQLDDAAALPAEAGLVLAGSVLSSLEQARSLSLLSYSSIDIYGAGTFTLAGRLALHAGEIRGFENGGGTATFKAQSVSLDNRALATVPGAIAGAEGTLAFSAATIRIGSNQLVVDQFATLELRAAQSVFLQGTGGLSTQGDLTLETPLLTGGQVAVQKISAGGALTIEAPAGAANVASAGGLGASVTLTGASIVQNSNIVLPSGTLTLRATTGDLTMGGKLDVSGTAQSFFDLVKYTSGGQINLAADAGSVNVGADGVITVAATSGGGNAGGLSISTPLGDFSLNGTLHAEGGAGGKNGSFTLDVGSLPALATLETVLDAAAFTEAQSIRVRTGDVLVDGVATAHAFNLSADSGAITVTGTIDASGKTGGIIGLEADGSVTLASGALLTVAADDFSHAGKGGAVSLETRGTGGAILDLLSGSTIDLSVATNAAGSAGLGEFTGTLHLRAPQLGGDVQVGAINSTILNASRVSVEGFQIYDLTGSSSIDSVKGDVLANGNAFLGEAGTTTAGYTAMHDRLLANNAGLNSVFTIVTGAEIINRTGDLTLSSSWDLSTYRFGPDSAAGDLTLRAAGDLVFQFRASLSDGFGGSSLFGLWDQQLLSPGSTSWTYRLVAGADIGAADVHQVQALSALAANKGSLLLGNGSPALPTNQSSNTPRSSIIPNYFQTIRTGTGEIEIQAGRDVQILNPLATIYTAGTQAEAMADFDTPVLNYPSGSLGTVQNPIYPAQYSLAGGNVSINAQNDIGHYLRVDGSLIADSSKEMPTNWLYRRGRVDTATGLFATQSGESFSTSWWIDFSNFFEGVGALGGGDVTLNAGNDINNVDAFTPTNARMPKGKPDASQLLELGGGDLVVNARRDINGGVYYVERGAGVLKAGQSIHTNATRATTNPFQDAGPTTWLATTLYLGKGSYHVSATGDVLLGPVVNPFMLPQGINNSYLKKSYFSTYAPANAVDVSSLTGDVTLKSSPVGGDGSLLNWYRNAMLTFQNPQSYANRGQPWLRLAESNINGFATAATLLPGTLRATSFSGDINVLGTITLAPAPRGTIDLAAAGSINGLQVNGANGATNIWGSSSINLSDADPDRISGVASPLAPSPLTSLSNGTVLVSFNSLFAESGSFAGNFGVIQTKQALHAADVLHTGDPDPVHLYALNGDISGVTLFSGKFSRVLAGTDITDIAFYLQNTDASDFSVVAAGRDLIAYDPNSPLRLIAQSQNNQLFPIDDPNVSRPASGTPSAGDIQINGPGTLEVLAGRNLDLGVGPSNPDGTQVGITSIGNNRNPFLPSEGADLLVGAGIGPALSLDQSALRFDQFIDEVLTPELLATYLPEVAGASHVTADRFKKLPREQRDRVALDIFYLILRDAGRDHSDPTIAGYSTYQKGFAAIQALFPGDGEGDITTQARDIRTKSGGKIDLFAPGGGLTMANTAIGSPDAPPGIITEDGGNISIFTRDKVDIGIARIFTLRGGNEIIWSSEGDIAAGSSSKTVQSAPPTRVVIDPQSGDVATDLAGLATGGGIGVLATVEGVPPGDVDLIAPAGTVDAGDAGIRVSGNLNISAVQVLNASNIQAGGTTSGVPVTVAAAPNIAGLTASSANAGATSSAASDQAEKQRRSQQQDEAPSIISVDVLSFGDEDLQQASGSPTPRPDGSSVY